MLTTSIGVDLFPWQLYYDADVEGIISMLSEDGRRALTEFHVTVRKAIDSVLRAVGYDDCYVRELPAVTLGSVPFDHLTKKDGLMFGFSINVRRKQHPCCEFSLSLSPASPSLRRLTFTLPAH